MAAKNQRLLYKYSQFGFAAADLVIIRSVCLDHVGTTNINLYFTFVLLRIYRKISQDSLLSMDEVKTPPSPSWRAKPLSLTPSVRLAPKVARPRRILKAIAPARACRRRLFLILLRGTDEERTSQATPRHERTYTVRTSFAEHVAQAPCYYTYI